MINRLVNLQKTYCGNQRIVFFKQKRSPVSFSQAALFHDII